MLLLPVALVFVYSYIPMAGIVISFMDYKPALGFAGSRFIGLEHFRTLFNNPQFSQALENTVVIAFWKIVFGLVVPVTFALLLNEVRNTAYKRVAQTVVYLPHFISWVLMSGIIIDFLSATGAMNQLLGLFGMEPVLFLLDNKLFKPVLIVTDIWKSFGWGTIIYMAALTGVDPNLYEAAAIDGAGRWKQTLHVTFPGILSTVVLKMTLSLGDDQVYNLMSPVTMQSGDILDTLIYRLGMENANFGLSTAVGLFKSLVGAVFIIVSYKLAHRFTGYKIF